MTALEVLVSIKSEIRSMSTADMEIFFPELKKFASDGKNAMKRIREQNAEADALRKSDGSVASDEFKTELDDLHSTAIIGIDGVGGLVDKFPSFTPVADRVKEAEARELWAIEKKAITDALVAAKEMESRNTEETVE